MSDKDLYYLISQQHLKLPMHNFTTEDLIQYLYGETSKEKSAAIKEALACDWNLNEAYEALKTGIEKLDEVSFSPRSKTIADLMRYAGKEVEPVSHHA